MNGDRGRAGDRSIVYLLAKHVASEYYHMDRKPPVTAGLIAANALIYFKPFVLNDLLPPLSEASLNPHLVIENKDIKRLVFSAFYHVDDSHFVYNMESLLREGVQLEMKGSTEFASAVVVLLGMSHGIEVLNSNPLKKELGIRKSLLGDVSGIIAGYLYLWLQRFFSCSNPFRPILRKFTWVGCLPLRLVQGYLNWW